MTPPSPGSRWALAVAALTALVFARSLGADFLNFDDQWLIVNNPHFRGFTASNLAWMFGPNWIQWYPLTWLTYAADYSVWGLAPFGFHLTSVLLHSLNAALAFRLFERLMEKNGAPAATRRPAAAIGALLFALHPLRVESVTWASERSDVLSGTFALSAVLAWIEEREGAALAFHALALASKSVGMALPLALGLLDALGLSGRRRRDARGEIAALAPMLALSVGAACYGAAGQARVGAAWSWAKLGLADRLAIASWSYAHGLAKTVLPFGLQALERMPRPFDPFEPRFVLAGALCVLLTALAWRLRRVAPALAAAWGGFLLLMAPTAGFLKIGPQLSADRYTYLSMIGVAGLAAEGARRLIVSRGARATGAAAALLLLLAGACWSRQGDWLTSERFWSALVEADPLHPTALMMLGRLRLQQGRTADGERLLRAAVDADPTEPSARNELATLLTNSGRAEEAVAFYRSAIALEPAHPITRYNLALALAKLNRRAEAVAALEEELGLIRDARGAKAPDPLRRQLALDPDEERSESLLRSLRGPR